MKAFRLASIILLSIILLTGVPYLGYVLYQRYSRPAASPLDAVPEKAAFVVRINNPSSLYEELNRSNLIWKEISAWPGMDGLMAEIGMIDSLTASNRSIRRLVRDNPVYITLSLTGRGQFGLMYLAGAGNDLTTAVLGEFLKGSFPGG